MKEAYIDIIEKSLAAYTNEDIREYIDEVKANGVTEHGFPRLGANIGVLMAHGRKLELKDVFIEIIELCLESFAHPVNSSKGGSNFSVREVCLTLIALEKTDVISKELLATWKEKLAVLELYNTYTNIVSEKNPTPANWAYFAVLSEQARGQLCGIDATAFLEHQLPSQLLRLDQNGMYHDAAVVGPHQPMVYDIVARGLLGFSVILGYNGKYIGAIEDMMEKSDDLTLKMQSVTGEIAFGGRSNQFIHNEAWLSAYYELRATILYKKGDVEKAGLFKAAANKATERTLWWLSQKPLSHVKNHYNPQLRMGCEAYAYFNKYMITVASNAYMAYLAANDDIKPAEKTVADIGGYVAQTGEDFHKVFMNAGGYFLQFECNANFEYDANGLGRIHKTDCDPRICLSNSFPDIRADFVADIKNKHGLSICCFKNTADGIICSAQDGVTHTLTSKTESAEKCQTTFDCNLNEDILIFEKYAVSSDGVDIEFSGADGVLLPVLSFDGAKQSEIIVLDGQIIVKHNGSFCRYTFNGKAQDYGEFFNRNGHYRAYQINTDKVHIEIGDINEL